MHDGAAFSRTLHCPRFLLLRGGLGFRSMRRLLKAGREDSKTKWLANLRNLDGRTKMLAEAVSGGRQFVRKSDGDALRWVLAFFANHPQNDIAMHDRASVLAYNLAALTESRSKNRRTRALSADRTLQALVADLVAARTAVCMTQEDVAARMGTTKSVVSRLESGVRSRPTLRTIERYALAVGASVEIRVRTAR